MKTHLTFLLPLCFAITAKTQIVDFYGKQVAADICSQYGMKDDNEAKKCLDKICDAADIPNNFVLAPCTNIDNCFALYKNGYSYIVYDINFFNKVKTLGFTSKNLPKDNIDWAALTILAHEIGHHMCLHTTNPNLSSIYLPVQLELQADEYAGSAMYKIGATLAQAQLAMHSPDVTDEPTLTHPARADRLAAIAKGWNKEYNKGPVKNMLPVKQVNTQAAPTAAGNGVLPVNEMDGSFVLKLKDGTDMPLKVNAAAVRGFRLASEENMTYDMGSSYPGGTEFKIYFTSSKPAYIYVIGTDSKHSPLVQLYPDKQAAGILDFDSRLKVAIPADNQYIQMDETPGVDYLCVIYSKDELNITQIKDDLANNPSKSFVTAVKEALGDKIVDEKDVFFQKDNIAFNAKCNGKTAIPIFVKIQHR